MKKTVVFGGSGFLGSYIADELETRGYKVCIADICEPKYISADQTFEYCNILDTESVKKIINDADIVYNFAALADIDKAANAPVKTMQINVMGNLNILEACRCAKVKRFVFASSAYAFSDKGSFYGISKHTSEKLIEEYAKKYNLVFTIIRYGSLYGERAGEDNFIYNVLKKAIFEKKLTMQGTGEEIREYIHAKDAAALSVDIIETDKYINDLLILTGVEKMMRRDLFVMIKEILNGSVKIKTENRPYHGHYKITPYVYHPSAAKKLVANPYIDMGQGLVDCIKAIIEQKEKVSEE